jgi:hypothetical protein
MRALTCVGISAAMILTFSAAAAETAAPSSAATRVPLKALQRDCDFAKTGTTGQLGAASASAQISTVGSRVVADIQLAEPSEPGAHFTVELIQLPRPSGAGCGPGSPGTAFANLDTDGAGQGQITVQDNISQGATGVWLVVNRPSEHTVDPVEFYTSDFVVPI